MAERLAISHKGNKLPALVAGVPFARMKNAVLGKEYELSLSFVSDAAMRHINSAYRGKDATTDVLSFELEKDAGEIFLSVKELTRRAPQFGLSPRDYARYLFIHGMVHLGGHDHGSRMSRIERSFCRKLDVPHPDDVAPDDTHGTAVHHRNRRRHASSQSGHRRGAAVKKRGASKGRRLGSR